MIQGGGFDASMNQSRPTRRSRTSRPTACSTNKYTLAMARTSAPHSATAQFFINATDNTFLTAPMRRDGWGYAVFGKVIEGTAVVDEIEKVRTAMPASTATCRSMPW